MSLEGDIGEIDLISRLVELGREQFTGAIRFENDGIIKIIYFKGGDVLSASTNDRADSIDEILLRAGKVTREHVKQALAKRKESETLGDALLNLGFITRKELTWARRVQAIGVIRSIDAWGAGSYTIVNDYLPKREEGTLFPLPQIIVELIVTDQDRQKFDCALDGGNAVLAKSPEFDEWYRRLGLNEDAARIAAAVDGRRSAAEVAAAVDSEAFNVYKLLHAFHVIGLLEPAGKPKGEPEGLSFDGHDDLASAGVADAADLWTAPPDPALASGTDAKSEPSFQFDLEPEPEAIAQPPAAAAEPTVEGPAAMPSWEAPQAEVVAGSMPGWDDDVPPPAPPPIYAEPQHEKQWGFDDAQIETARRGSARGSNRDEKPPMRKTVKEASHSNRWTNILILGVALLVVTFGGYAGFLWWQGRQAASTAQRTPRATAKHPVIRPRPSSTSTSPTSTMATTTAPLTPATGSLGTTPSTAATARTATSTSVPPVATVTATTAPMAPMTIAAKPIPIAKAAPAPQQVAKRPPPAAPPVTNTTAHVERNAAGSAVITNTSATAGSDATRRKYDAIAQQHAAGASGNYTIQFELVCQTSSLTTATRTGGERVWFVPITYRGQSCYRVFWGHYATREAASAATGEIPSSLRGPSPTVVPVPR